jgi:hypothetical protein
MAISTFKEIHNGRLGSEKLSSGGVIATYTRVFRAVTDTVTDEAATIMSDPQCPKKGIARYPWNTYAYCDEVSPVQDDRSKNIWIVTVRYTTKREYASNPLSDPAEIEWASAQFQRVASKDKDGNAIVNSAGDPYDPPPMRDDSRWVVTVRKNLAAVPSWLLTFQDAVNSSGFTLDGLAVGTRLAKMQGIRIGKWQHRNSQPYRVLTMVIHLAKDNWDLKVQDVGFRRKDGADRVPILKNGIKPTAPVPLNGSGDVLADPTPATVKFNIYEVYDEQNFNNLPLQ